jgi:hypothetical protein
MAEGTAPVEAAKQITKAPLALLEFCKKYWWMGPLLLLAIMGLGMAIKPWFADKVTTKAPGTTGPATVAGDKLPDFLRKFLRIAGFLLPFFVLFGSDYVYAACAGHGGAPCAWQEVGGWLAQGWAYLAMLGAAMFFAISHLSAPDQLDARTERNGRSLAYTPGDEQEVSLFMRTATKNRTAGGQPYVAVDTTIAVDTTVEQVSTGTNPILSQDLARLLKYVQIFSPFDGVILDKKTGTGPVLDLAISFIGQGFSRAGDAPLVTITVPETDPNDQAVTKYFTFPWEQRILFDSSASTPWLGALDNMEIAIGLAASTALAAVSTGAGTKGASKVRAGTSYAISPFWRQTYLPYWRVDQPASGSDGLSFQNFGGTGPSSTKAVDIVHTIGQLSSLAGLPGNLTFDTITGIIAPAFGLDDIANIDLLVKERINAQSYGRIGSDDFANGGNHVQGTPNVGMALDALLFLLLRQPSLEMKPETMLRYDSNSRLPLREEFSEEREGADAFLIGGLRERNDGKMRELSALSGGRMPTNMAQARHFRAK